MGFCKAYKNKRGYGFDQNVKFESIDSADCIAYVCESNEILVDVDNPNAVKYFEAVLDYYNIPDSMKHRSKSGGMHYLFTIPHGLKIPFKSRTKACLFIGHFDDVTQKHSGVDIKCGNSALSHVRADDIGFTHHLRVNYMISHGYCYQQLNLKMNMNIIHSQKNMTVNTLKDL